MKAMLQQLRTAYPEGCLITEIVSIEGGNYLIRTSVQIAGAILVNGFAISDDLEVAQDKALDRIMKMLGIKSDRSEESPSATGLPEVSPVVENGRSIAISEKLPLATSLAQSSPVVEIKPSITVSEDLPSAIDLSESTSVVESEPNIEAFEDPPLAIDLSESSPVVESEPNIEAFEDSPLAIDLPESTPVVESEPSIEVSEDLSSAIDLPEPSPIVESEPIIAVSEPESAPEPEPSPPFPDLKTSGIKETSSKSSLPDLALDLNPAKPPQELDLTAEEVPVEPLPIPSLNRSDLQTQALVEMERLGWTRTKGRDHLIAKYGKKTRSELTDAELNDFCTYLQSLP
jgi:hypothetical protein